MSSGFHLDKWYLDGVSDDGVCVIAYRAEVRFRALRVRFASVMVARPGGRVVTRSTVRGGAEPVVDDTRVRWVCAGLGVKIEVQRGVRGASRRLLESEAGVIDWECVAPGGRVRAVVDGETWTGTGYAERLLMTVPPQRLPMRTLRWGRFVADDGSEACAWIQWRGAEERGLVLCGGEFAMATEISEECCSWESDAGSGEVTWAGSRAALVCDSEQSQTSATRVLRESEAEGTLLERIPALRRFAPPMVRAALGLKETKWLARGEMRVAGRAARAGWVVHEVVTFAGEGA
jgi:hypothetical protein